MRSNLTKTSYRDLPYESNTVIDITIDKVWDKTIEWNDSINSYKTSIPCREGFKELRVGEILRVQYIEYMGNVKGVSTMYAKFVRIDNE